MLAVLLKNYAPSFLLNQILKISTQTYYAHHYQQPLDQLQPAVRQPGNAQSYTNEFRTMKATKYSVNNVAVQN